MSLRLPLLNVRVAIAAVATLASLAAACGGGGGGGGGGGSGPTPPPPTPTPIGLVGCNAGATSIMAGRLTDVSVRHPNYMRSHVPYAPGFISVKFSGSGTEPEIARAMTRIGAKQSSTRNDFGYVSYSIPETSNPLTAAASLAGTRGISDARPIAVRYLQTIPNDPDLGVAPPYSGPITGSLVQWDMYFTQMPAAWGVTMGSASVKIAIIDTGYDANNLDICSKVVSSAVFDHTNGDGLQNTTATAQDDDGHGSNVSGIAAAVTNNGLRFAGVGWNIDLMEVRVFPTPSVANPNPPGALDPNLGAAINWAVSHGANVISMSLGATGSCASGPSEQSAIAAALSAGVAVVAAAGNDSGQPVIAPANCPGVIAVGATGLNDSVNPAVEKIASYSNFDANRTWGVVAPGGDPSTAQQSCTAGVNCDYLQWIINNYSTTACCASSTPPNSPGHGVLIAGTSQATPHVAGVAALMITKDPGISPASIRSILEANIDDICSCNGEGFGRLNAIKALNATP